MLNVFHNISCLPIRNINGTTWIWSMIELRMLRKRYKMIKTLCICCYKTWISTYYYVKYINVYLHIQVYFHSFNIKFISVNSIHFETVSVHAYMGFSLFWHMESQILWPNSIKCKKNIALRTTHIISFSIIGWSHQKITEVVMNLAQLSKMNQPSSLHPYIWASLISLWLIFPESILRFIRDEICKKFVITKSGVCLITIFIQNAEINSTFLCDFFSGKLKKKVNK